MSIYTRLFSGGTQKKQFAVLIDPDKAKLSNLKITAEQATKYGVDLFLVGGSLLTEDSLKECITFLNENTDIPVVLFPGNTLQIDKNADAILFLSLISGRNPEMLIGRHVIAAPYIKAANLESIPTGYMLIDNGHATTASYMSNSTPIPHEKDDIAVCTAMAGDMLGLKLIYMDAGSGADKNIRLSMISKVKNSINIPLIIGGGIRDAQTAVEICNAGADVIVVGNAIEKNIDLIKEIGEAIQGL